MSIAEKAIAELVVAEAKRWLGTPYRHQSSHCGIGSDCLGLIRGVWRGVYGREPETPPAYAADWGEADGSETLLAAACRHLHPIDTIEPGAVLLFRWKLHLPARHAAIATNDTTMIHACETAGVTLARLTPFWRARLAASFRFPDHT